MSENQQQKTQPQGKFTIWITQFNGIPFSKKIKRKAFKYK